MNQGFWAITPAHTSSVDVFYHPVMRGRPYLRLPPGVNQEIADLAVTSDDILQIFTHQRNRCSQITSSIAFVIGYTLSDFFHWISDRYIVFFRDVKNFSKSYVM